MPGEGNALQFEINKLMEKLKTEKNPEEIAKIQASIKELRRCKKEINELIHNLNVDGQ